MSILVAGDYFHTNSTHLRSPLSIELQNLLHSTEYVVVNLEAPLTERGKTISKIGPNLRMNPQYAKVLHESGVDCVCLANNHLRDFGDEGIEDTLKFCKNAGLDVVGAGMNKEDAGKPLIKQINMQRIAFLNYCEREFSIAGEDRPGANPFDTIQAYYDITSMKEQVDRIVVIYHGGLENQHLPTPEMVKAFRFMMDVGADAVIAHHMHAYSGYELYDDKPIYYGLGNFFFYKSQILKDEHWYKGLLVTLHNESKSMKSAFIPISTDKRSEIVDIAKGTMAESMLRHISEINEVIKCPSLFSSYWEERYSAMQNTYLLTITTKSRIAYRVARKLGLHPKISQYRINIILNMLRCDSHRQSLVNILESLQICEQDKM